MAQPFHSSTCLRESRRAHAGASVMSLQLNLIKDSSSSLLQLSVGEAIHVIGTLMGTRPKSIACGTGLGFIIRLNRFVLVELGEPKQEKQRRRVKPLTCPTGCSIRVFEPPTLVFYHVMDRFFFSTSTTWRIYN